MPAKALRRLKRVRRWMLITEVRCRECGAWFEAKRLMTNAKYCPQPAQCRMQASKRRVSRRK